MEFRYAVDSTQQFLYGGLPAPYDVVPGLSPGQVRVVSARQVDRRTERWNGSADPTACTRPATAAEIAAYDTFRLTEQSVAGSRDKTLMTLLGVMIRGRNVAAWDALTPAQQVQAIRAEAAAWKTIRELLEDKVP